MENKDVKSTATNISELTKWGTIIMAGITAVVLLSDWVYTLNYYRALGVSELASSKFLTDPIHYSGVLSLWVGFLMVGGYCLFMILLINVSVKPLLGLFPRKFHIPIIFVLAIIAYITATNEAKNLVASSLSPEIIAVVPFLSIAPVMVLLWFFAEHYIKDSAIKNAVFLVLILISANFFYMSFIVKFSATAGKSDGEKILQGEQSLPVVALITKEKIIISEKITALQIDDGKWLYSPQYTNHPKTGKTIMTMQFIGTDERNIYILDLWGSSVHAIAKDSIMQVVYFNFSDDSLISSGVTPNFITISTPTQ